jgi:hypothetical protein
VTSEPPGPAAGGRSGGRPRSRLAVLPFRFLLEIGSIVSAQRGTWTRTARKLVGAFIVLALVDLNSSHVRDFVRALVRSWQEAQTQTRMGSLAAALDAEFASYSRYPDPEAFHEFARTWVDSTDGDPARDHWGTLITLSVDGVAYELVSCGRDTLCGTTDDLRRRGGLVTPAMGPSPP